MEKNKKIGCVKLYELIKELKEFDQDLIVCIDSNQNKTDVTGLEYEIELQTDKELLFIKYY